MTLPAVNTVVRRRAVPEAAALPQDLHPVLRRIFAARGVSSADDLAISLGALPPAQGLKGIDAAVTLLCEAITENRHILVVADYDADGATSCAVAVKGLRALGARRVSYVVPDRFRYGYGLSPEIVAVAARQEPDLIVTVDNGISSVEGVAAARAQGIPVLVTDHHLPGDTLPAAAAIVNPNQPGCDFPTRHLAGVGVMFYVLLALRSALREQGRFSVSPEPNLAELLDLVALGTVADVVILDRFNRVLVEQGLRRIRAGRASSGIQALLTVAGRDAANLVATDLGFAVAPRLNAAGRLTEMSLGIECLLSEDSSAALEMATRLDSLNRERRGIEQEMQDQAWEALRSLHLELRDGLPFGLCLFDPGWHQGVVGILASRVKDRLHRPVIAFAPGEAGELKGSARSVPGLHIRDALDAVAARHPGLVVRFGGHAMAAGLTLFPEHMERFSAAFDEEVRRHLQAEALQGVFWSDGELAPDDLTLPFAQLLREAAPWGQGFPEPQFDGRFHVLDRRVVGEVHLKLVVRPEGGEQGLDAIWFRAHELEGIRIGDVARLVYRLDINEYRGRRTLQLIIDHLEPLSTR